MSAPRTASRAEETGHDLDSGLFGHLLRERLLLAGSRAVHLDPFHVAEGGETVRGALRLPSRPDERHGVRESFRARYFAPTAPVPATRNF